MTADQRQDAVDALANMMLRGFAERPAKFAVAWISRPPRTLARGLAVEAIEVWSSWRDGRTATLIQVVGAIVSYAEHDASEAVDVFDKVHAELGATCRT
jgi:hypothetical protein